MLPLSRRENRTVLRRYLRFYEWFNGNVLPPSPPSPPYPPSPSNNTWKTFRYARSGSLVLLDGKRRHSRRISLDLSSLFISAFASPSRECSEVAAFRTVHRETEHVFCFSPPVRFRRYMRIEEEPRSSFSIWGTLWVKTILLNSFQRFPCQEKTQI